MSSMTIVRQSRRLALIPLLSAGLAVTAVPASATPPEDVPGNAYAHAYAHGPDHGPEPSGSGAGRKLR